MDIESKAETTYRVTGREILEVLVHAGHIPGKRIAQAVLVEVWDPYTSTWRTVRPEDKLVQLTLSDLPPCST
jgi:hypothetical protein